MKHHGADASVELHAYCTLHGHEALTVNTQQLHTANPSADDDCNRFIKYNGQTSWQKQQKPIVCYHSVIVSCMGVHKAAMLVAASFFRFC